MTGSVLIVGQEAVAFGSAFAESLNLPWTLDDARSFDGRALIRRAGSPDVEAVVICRSHIGGDAAVEQLAAGVSAPLVLLPAEESRRELSRVLVPLDGSAEADAAARTVGQALSGRGLEVLVLHVIDTATVPAFWDQPVHAGRTYAREFLHSWDDEPGTRLELRTGSPIDAINDTVEAEQIDLVAIGWAQKLAPNRCHTARAALRSCACPLLMLGPHGQLAGAAGEQP